MRTVDIDVENVTMRFRLSNEKIDNLKEYFLRVIKKNIRYTEFSALNSISFKIYNGERVGIIGHNGAGKSTLLKIISGVMKPTVGKITVNGDIAPLLELGAGFDPEFSGAENIYLNGAILGSTKEYLDSKFNEIVEFSELGTFINTPVKNYSSGMRARLGFSIATQVDARILIVDEILGVGDEQFKKKSSDKMMEMMQKGKTIILVSHNINEIKSLTDKVIWLHKGEVKEIGETKLVCSKYESFMNNNT
ncbi:ATP-binding cassette domain-containing protein [Paenibacillus sp. LMG 31461]|uniref:ATP-binding cassette domain-containing protein n=1 Tax=Paenibacillus plantarum TaxID=2654975 RepID=A0ABX1XCP5_9BACL|nr:ABC transporter ATP-binding protein [Paenibacillus plantarum]NOU66228.1 ATP-binding cassette domain-containing protein [Paenibacillus plantarum]